jgi:hypothetical protein
MVAPRAIAKAPERGKHEEFFAGKTPPPLFRGVKHQEGRAQQHESKLDVDWSLGQPVWRATGHFFFCTQSIQEHGAQTALAMVDFRGEKWPYSQFRMDCEGLSWFETLRIHAQILGDRPFLTTLDLAARVETVQLTFAGAHSLASHAAHLLQTSPKFKLGDRVLILHESTKELGLATLACFFAGAVAGASSACSLIPCDAGFFIYISSLLLGILL